MEHNKMLEAYMNLLKVESAARHAAVIRSDVMSMVDSVVKRSNRIKTRCLFIIGFLCMVIVVLVINTATMPTVYEIPLKNQCEKHLIENVW